MLVTADVSLYAFMSPAFLFCLKKGTNISISLFAIKITNLILRALFIGNYLALKFADILLW